ncbi:hypothetical protein [Sphingopyxis sp.]|uniref:hypothetical protein n=1 Tax=Sphingopyxis sp. TaxID=1908224 RepID=UPI003BA8B746
MSLKEHYTAFLRERLQSRSDDLRTALMPLLREPPSMKCQIEIAIFPDDGLTEQPPILVHAFGPDGMQIRDVDGVAHSNDLLRTMPPLISTDERDRFYVWEGEGRDRMIALEQPTDDVDKALLRVWVRNAWQGLDKGEYRCRTAIVVHDDEDIEIL